MCRSTTEPSVHRSEDSVSAIFVGHISEIAESEQIKKQPESVQVSTMSRF